VKKKALTDYERWEIWNIILNAVRKEKGLPVVTTPNPYPLSKTKKE